MDVVETDSIIYIMTERVQPLQSVLSSWSSRDSLQREDWLLWGLHRISVCSLNLAFTYSCCVSHNSQVALAFVNDSCSSTHGNVSLNSIFISPSGEWKLGGFELVSNTKEDASTLYVWGYSCFFLVSQPTLPI